MVGKSLGCEQVEGPGQGYQQARQRVNYAEGAYRRLLAMPMWPRLARMLLEVA